MAPYIEAIDAQQLSYYIVSVNILKFLFLAFHFIFSYKWLLANDVMLMD